ncbi:hypothetical protein HYH03_009315 [Edaphochlamys debaryana]|uniref:Poly(A) RNA polymerase mitochondrial-like central palm domain-containing protein n=1 Tax=Edaphochlamys debaryana TaxID=47281 RepID=A0A835XZB1_9CHLO|nr:hypothetical protein HYH03_009315 [Edaphochlamys debaryana]|eukprot:KAG2492367.1 hypothetical protein HYH03_009315 [Edaphochlamys debaryana]
MADDGLEEALEKLVAACSPANTDYEKRVSLISALERTFQARLGQVEKLRVVPYGSFVSQFYTCNSDLDLAITGVIPAHKLKPSVLAEVFQGRPQESHVSVHQLDKRSKARLLREAGDCLVRAGFTSREGLECILHARVPILKFADRRSGVEVDLCLGHEATTPFKAWSVQQVASIHPSFAPLFRVVKVWAKAHGINDGASHMFNSWALTLLVIFFLQKYEGLLPPLHALLYDTEPKVSTPRIMQGGADLPAEVFAVMQARAERAREVFGSRPSRPLPELFRAFVERGAALLRALLASQEALRRDTRVSAFYGDFQRSRPFASAYVLLLEDPYDDSDNTARTFGTWDGHPGTIHYVTSVFERTARKLSQLLSPEEPLQPTSAEAAGPAARVGGGGSGEGDRASSDDEDEDGEEEGATSQARHGASAGPGPGPGPGSSRTSAPAASSGPVQAPPSGSSLASALVFLFGTELLTRLPELSDSLLGAQLAAWARRSLREGRPPGEVHEALLKQLGATDEFVSFESFKRRHKIKVLNEVKYATPEEKAAAAARETARRDAKRAKEAAKRAAKQEAAAAERRAKAALAAAAGTQGAAAHGAAAGQAASRAPGAAAGTAAAAAAAALRGSTAEAGAGAGGGAGGSASASAAAEEGAARGGRRAPLAVGAAAAAGMAEAAGQPRSARARLAPEGHAAIRSVLGSRQGRGPRSASTDRPDSQAAAGEGAGPSGAASTADGGSSAAASAAAAAATAAVARAGGGAGEASTSGGGDGAAAGGRGGSARAASGRAAVAAAGAQRQKQPGLARRSRGHDDYGGAGAAAGGGGGSRDGGGGGTDPGVSAVQHALAGLGLGAGHEAASSSGGQGGGGGEAEGSGAGTGRVGGRGGRGERQRAPRTAASAADAGGDAAAGEGGAHGEGRGSRGGRRAREGRERTEEASGAGAAEGEQGTGGAARGGRAPRGRGGRAAQVPRSAPLDAGDPAMAAAKAAAAAVLL